MKIWQNLGKKSNTDYDFSPHCMWAENNKMKLYKNLPLFPVPHCPTRYKKHLNFCLKKFQKFVETRNWFAVISFLGSKTTNLRFQSWLNETTADVFLKERF